MQAQTAFLIRNLNLECTSEANKLHRMHPPEPAMVLPPTGVKSTFAWSAFMDDNVLSGVCLLNYVSKNEVVNFAYKKIYEQMHKTN